MKTVLITGATGNIGQKLRENLEATGKYALRLLCLNPGNDPAVHTADLHLRSRPGRRVRWCRYSAAHRDGSNPRASWARIQSRNIGLMLNVLPAAQQHHVRRVVFASSYFVVAVQRFSAGALTTTMEPALINPYDASKLFSARVGKMFSERYGVSFIALRMGVCQRANGKFAWSVDSLRPLAPDDVGQRP